MSCGTLHIVATPIGRLDDFSARAQHVCKEVSVVYAEDTRVTKKLFAAYSISTPIERLDHHASVMVMKKAVARLIKGDDVALVCDAGTPAVSDPGYQFVAYVSSHHPEVQITPVPGACAATAALSVSGMSADRFIFLGFPPHKKGRASFFSTVAGSECTTVLYESPHRIAKTLAALADVLESGRTIAVCRELTKKFETIHRCTAGTLLNEPVKEKGEFVIVIAGK
jgi:16S rRNA (cytidine1402-2'-O)-methyltransferase